MQLDINAMAFSRERELLKAQALITRERRRKIRQYRRSQETRQDSHAAKLPAMPVFDHVDEGTVGPVYDDNDDNVELSVYENDAPTDLPTIFVSVPSYRDPECAHTVADCFEKAAFPGRVFVGVFEQNSRSEDRELDCMSTETAQRFASNIRRDRVDASEAKGPIYARAHIEQTLYQNEDYVLQIDSHTLFSHNWDTECVRQLEMCDSPKPVLTCYPEEYSRETREIPPETVPPSFLKFRDFHPRKGFWQLDRVRFAEFPGRPVRSLFWAAGFSFSRGDAVREVPNDPSLQYMFLGEEASMTARLYTHGWDMFAPTTHLVFHYTPRDYRPVFWEQFYKRNGVCMVSADVRAERRALEAASEERVRALLGNELPEDDPYGLGSARTLAQMEEFVGVDLQNKRHKQRAKFGLTPDADAEEHRVRYGGGGGE